MLDTQLYAAQCCSVRPELYRCNLLKVVQVAAHEEGGGGHEEVQHLAGEDGHVWVLPEQRADVEHEALSHESEQCPVRGEEHHPLLRHDAGNDLEKVKNAQTVKKPHRLSLKKTHREHTD